VATILAEIELLLLASYNLTALVDKLEFNTVPTLLGLFQVDLDFVALLNLASLLTGPTPLKTLLTEVLNFKL
jgi:hypothetical protein